MHNKTVSLFTSLIFFIYNYIVFSGVTVFSITKTQATLTSPSLVQLLCVAVSHPAVQSVAWYDVNGGRLNSTSLVSEEEHDSGRSVVMAILEVERRTCVDTMYTCVFENGITSQNVDLECPPSESVSV